MSSVHTKISQKSFLHYFASAGCFFDAVSVAARKKATVHMQESNFASCSTGHISAYIMQLTCACTARMERHCISRHDTLSLWHYQGSLLLQGPWSQKPSRQPCCVERWLSKSAHGKGELGQMQSVKLNK